ncbi:hypothetical protein LJ754_16325 [Arthrobacter sp. zg-Y40]|uniref:hypothetical protein n=1 Tax=Arthrobacter sp. zg-Y40 TaxID=2886939 RepID=UPI001D1590BB|nr:hypothetical protein [Arthrobacter sp. zg-Y40]MCC3280714.1 hypothetical protein [Arthrobacter sp. zg-Y40]
MRISDTNNVTAAHIIEALRAHGVESLVYAIDNDTAAIYATFSTRIVIACPGAYIHSDPSAATFNTDVLYVGTTDEGDPGMIFTPGATIDQITEAFITAGR